MARRRSGWCDTGEWAGREVRHVETRFIASHPLGAQPRIEIDAFSSTVRCGRRGRTERRIATPAVWVDKRQTFYLPAALADLLR